MNDQFPGSLIGGPDAEHTFQGETAMGKRLSDVPYSINEHGDTIINFDIMGLARGLAEIKRLSDTEQRVLAKALRRSVDVINDPGFAEIKRMEALMIKAPCLARLDELAAWSAKDD